MCFCNPFKRPVIKCLEATTKKFATLLGFGTNFTASPGSWGTWGKAETWGPGALGTAVKPLRAHRNPSVRMWSPSTVPRPCMALKHILPQKKNKESQLQTVCSTSRRPFSAQRCGQDPSPWGTSVPLLPRAWAPPSQDTEPQRRSRGRTAPYAVFLTSLVIR